MLSYDRLRVEVSSYSRNMFLGVVLGGLLLLVLYIDLTEELEV